MKNELRLFETSNQFVIIEDGLVPPEDVEVYSIKRTSNAQERYTMKFPQFELMFESKGDYGYIYRFNIIYRGLSMNFYFDPASWKKTVIDFLNELKNGDYQKEIEEYFMDNCLDKNYLEANKKLLEFRYNYDYWKNKVDNLNAQIANLENENKKLQNQIEKI